MVVVNVVGPWAWTAKPVAGSHHVTEVPSEVVRVVR